MLGDNNDGSIGICEGIITNAGRVMYGTSEVKAGDIGGPCFRANGTDLLGICIGIQDPNWSLGRSQRAIILPSSYLFPLVLSLDYVQST